MSPTDNKKYLGVVTAFNDTPEAVCLPTSYANTYGEACTSMNGLLVEEQEYARDMKCTPPIAEVYMRGREVRKLVLASRRIIEALASQVGAPSDLVDAVNAFSDLP